MNPEAIPLLKEVRDLVVAQDATVEALREALIELRVKTDRDRRRALDEAVKRRRLEHEVRELTGRVHMLEGGKP